MFPVKFTSERALDLSKYDYFQFFEVCVTRKKATFLGCVDQKREVSELSQVTHIVTFVKG